MNPSIRTTLFALICIALISLVGCGKVNKENYSKLKPGMSYDEVVALLGEPDNCDSLLALKNCTWGKEPKTINIQIAADKVVLFESKGL